MLLGTNGLKTLLVLKIFKFLFLKNRLDKKARVNFKIYNVKNRETNNGNTHVTQYLKE